MAPYKSSVMLAVLSYFTMHMSFCLPECQQKEGKSSTSEKVLFFKSLRPTKSSSLFAFSLYTLMRHVAETRIRFTSSRGCNNFFHKWLLMV